MVPGPMGSWGSDGLEGLVIQGDGENFIVLSFERRNCRSGVSRSILKVLLLRDRPPGSLHEGLDFLEGKAAIFVRVQP